MSTDIPTPGAPLEEALAWRQNRPPEDPEKTKRWGFVTAKPSEYLIHMRRGRIRGRTTGQGASCWKWPWDAVAIIPTTINRLQFSADQVTLEKVGVRVTGLAVYRIVEPEIAFRMLNFSYSERASEKLAEILREMFVGATRRHVANLDVESVMTRRKDAIASELLAELAPVLAGRGRTDDSTSMGWGVVLDTVEIQDVRVLSERVFADMQAPFRAELAARARMNELGRERTIMEAERELVERRHEAARRDAQMEAERRTAKAELEATLKEADGELRARLAARDLEIRRATDEQETARARTDKEIEDMVSDARTRLELVTTTMPALAHAFARQIGELRMVQIGAEGDPSTMIARGLAQVMEVARGLGLSLSARAPDDARAPANADPAP